MRKYLEELGVKLENIPCNWSALDDCRQGFWKQQREECGFDERDTWSLDYTMRLLLYERLKMFIEHDDCIRTDKIYEDEEGSVYSMEDILNKILTGLELDIIGGEDTSENTQLKEEVWSWYSVIERRLWW